MQPQTYIAHGRVASREVRLLAFCVIPVRMKSMPWADRRTTRPCHAVFFPAGKDLARHRKVLLLGIRRIEPGRAHHGGLLRRKPIPVAHAALPAAIGYGLYRAVLAPALRVRVRCPAHCPS